MQCDPASIRPRALGGGSLEGSRLMRLVYLDEAGISSGEPTLVVSGVVIDGDRQLSRLERALARVVARWIPSEHQEGFVFHAKEIFNGGGKVFQRDTFPLSKRLSVVDDLVELICDFELPIVFGMVEKNDYPRDAEWRDEWKQLPIREQISSMHTSAFMDCSMGIEKYMRELGEEEICLLVVENNDQSRAMIKRSQRYNQSQAAFEAQNPAWKYMFPFQRIKEDPLFQEKKSSSPMQLADLMAYIVKKSLMKDERYYPVFQRLMSLIVLHPDPEDVRP
jgi:hypothetical protein